METAYSEESVNADENLHGWLPQGQEGVIDDLEDAAYAMAAAALTKIDHLEEAVSDYEMVEQRLTGQLDEHDGRIGERSSEVLSTYDQLLSDGEFDDYRIKALRKRAANLVGEATGREYDGVAELREEVYDMGAVE